MIHRFPREEALKGKHGFRMNDVWNAVEKVAKGEQISPRARVLIQRWFSVPHMTKRLAKQILRPGFDGHFRFRRS